MLIVLDIELLSASFMARNCKYLNNLIWAPVLLLVSTVAW